MQQSKVITLNPEGTEVKEPKGGKVSFYSNTATNGIEIVSIDYREDGAGRTIIWPLAFAARTDNFELQRFAVIASLLKARIIVVELPGVSVNSYSRLSFMQKASIIFWGNLKNPAKMMLQAIKDYSANATDAGSRVCGRIEFAGYSQGVPIAVEMMKILSEDDQHALGSWVTIDRFTMIEPVNDQIRTSWDILGVRSLIDILQKIGREDQFTNRYLDQNNEYTWLEKPSDRTDGIKEYLKHIRKDLGQKTNENISGSGLRTPFLNKLLGAINYDKRKKTSGIRNADFDIITFNESGMSKKENNILMADRLSSSVNGKVRLYNFTAADGKGLHHPAFHSIPVMVEVVKKSMV